jgi:hypothetical protein
MHCTVFSVFLSLQTFRHSRRHPWNIKFVGFLKIGLWKAVLFLETSIKLNVFFYYKKVWYESKARPVYTLQTLHTDCYYVDNNIAGVFEINLYLNTNPDYFKFFSYSFTLEQALKAYRWSIGIALLFLLRRR